ncbi:FAD-binding oxidoreductase [Hwanghaeella grinnelliae]|uniref:FAD-binding oxidoreductase n=1 Tax=Hwanghaeella grinnelliae TaxID=2500179 RepID=A0A437QI20_9PROT|nr:FAD-binding oxidoreductase [Hwanghaeella grinnelliae]RVU34169.1 FAD-binding oxidoreductase [Hwanghaeella grinnelliae]
MAPDGNGGRAQKSVADEVLNKLKDILGPKGWSQDADTLAPLLVDTRGYYHGACALLARPETTEQVAAIMKVCHEAGVPVVPQGGNTSRVGSATPDESGGTILLSLARMNTVREVDPVDYTMTVEAGCVLKDLQDAAEAKDRLFPLSLGAEGSCMIGGNIASNAGGINVLRYGNTRDLVLGLEVVLPNGEIWNGLRRLRKDNTGYDLKQWFIGSEGTLGIVTAAVLKLFPLPKERATALCAIRDLDACLDLLARARAASGDALSSFELLAGITLDFAYQHVDSAKRAMEGSYDWNVLFEFSGLEPGHRMNDALETMLEKAFEDGVVIDAVIAQSEQQRADIWFLREAVVEAQAAEGASIKHDVSVPVSKVPEFINRSNEALHDFMEGIRPYPFGHVGDGNIHYNVTQPAGMDADAYMAAAPEIHDIVHGITADLNGSISAEHGIGQLKREELKRYKTKLELDLMRQLKSMLDPQGLMNPGKVLDI